MLSGKGLLRPAAACAAAFALLVTPAAADPPLPGEYQEDDFLGFRNVIPPGQNGFANSFSVGQFIANGTRPAHSADQLPLYDDLVYEAPGLTETQVDTFFKDASFGAPAAQSEPSYTPDCAVVSAPSASSPHCDDVTIVRDSAYGVPHIYGADRAGLMFGIGYATAEDRLFTMDVQRHAGRAELSSFLGGSNVGMDRSTWRAAPYTDEDLQLQYDRADDLYGVDGAQVQADVQNYVDGVNQYIAEARVGPTGDDPGNMIPANYALIGKPQGPEPWHVTDIIATASLVSGIFGKGGGGELRSAQVLSAAEARFGEDGGDVWADFRSAEDPEAPTTVHDGTEFPYGATPENPVGVALPDAGTLELEPIVVDTTAAARPGRGDSFVADMAALEMSSNALLVSADESASGTPLAVMGPQVGYFNPSALMEQDIHAPASAEGPAIDARGVAFAGANLYVQLGRGQDYSWSATSAGQDITDTFALELCDPEGGTVTLQSDHYLYDGECLPFEEVERTNSWTPSLADPTPAGTETIRALRTELGLVTHRAMVDEVPTAYTQLRATYFHEADSATGFADFNSPDRVASSADFRQAANKIDYTFNWFYADNQDIAYFNSGANPVRAENTDPNLPIMGAPEFAWEGYDPEDLTFDRAPFAEHAQVENQDYLTNWNNKQAPGFRASDDSYSYGSVHRSEPLDDRILEEIEGPGLMTRAELVDAAEDAATVDLRGDKVLVYALRVIRGGPALKNKKVRRAAKALAQWERAGAHRRDPDGNGVYARSRAIRLMDAWWPRLVTAQFRGPLGADLYESVESMMGIDNRPGAGGSAYGSGWYGYVEKDLRSVLGLSVEGAFSREYCGGGSLAECRRLLRRSFARAVKNSAPEDVYPGEDCPEGNLQWCNDAIRHTEFGVIRQPRIHWQNRPTFQQVVEVQGHR